MQELRDSFNILHVGAKKTGKTTESLKIMVDFWENQQKPCIVLDLNNHPSFQPLIPLSIEQVRHFNRRKHGNKPYYVFRPDADPMAVYGSVLEFCQAVAYYVRNSVVIYDDFTTYVEGNFHPLIKGLILGNRNACNDYIFNVHSFGDVGPFVLKHTEIYMIRDTADDPNDLPTKIPVRARSLVRQALIEVSRENRSVPEGKPRLAHRTINKDEGRFIK